MELLSLYGLKLIIAVVLSFAILSLFGVGWLLRLRIIGTMAVGIVFLGFLAWPMVKPTQPLGAITLFDGDINLFAAICCLFLAYLAGLVSFFVCYPIGGYVAPLAAPAGLSIWALITGDMSSLITLNSTLASRQRLYSTLKWEGFFWLGVVGAGFLGVKTAQLLTKKLAPQSPAVKPDITTDSDERKSSINKGLTVAVAFIATVLITHFAIGIFAQDVRIFDSELGSVTGQPEAAQIAFAVMLSFGIAGFVLKKFLNVSYLVTAFATAIVTYVAITISAKPDVLAHMVENWPAAFFPRATSAILPIQIVSFGVIGSLAGYWVAIQVVHSHQESKNDS
ncbi:MAG TPA: hypothetical protein ENH94_07090 [Phycisphaerales bacterium]|nr:hypothetical protein [Phycisphaerales bacterium]